jgi:hypothetical protein
VVKLVEIVVENVFRVAVLAGGPAHLLLRTLGRTDALTNPGAFYLKAQGASKFKFSVFASCKTDARNLAATLFKDHLQRAFVLKCF